MKTAVKALATAAVIGLGSSAANAAPINVGGVVWDPDSGLDFTVQAMQMRETAVEEVGDELAGAGRIGDINGTLSSTFCPGCDLTFEFGGYDVSRIEGSEVAFTGGWINVYTDFTQSFSETDTSTWGQGDIWLQLTGVDHIRATSFGGDGEIATLFSNVTGTVNDPGFGSAGFGLLDVIGGLAADYVVRGDVHQRYETGLMGFADLSLDSSFQRVDDGFDSHPIRGTAQITGETQRIPEPGSIALLGVGLLFMAFVLYRRRGNASTDMPA